MPKDTQTKDWEQSENGAVLSGKKEKPAPEDHKG